MMCRIIIFIIFGSEKFNFEYPDINTMRIITDIKFSVSDTIFTIEMLGPFGRTVYR
jgi:hypothetical protein